MQSRRANVAGFGGLGPRAVIRTPGLVGQSSRALACLGRSAISPAGALSSWLLRTGAAPCGRHLCVSLPQLASVVSKSAASNPGASPIRWRYTPRISVAQNNGMKLTARGASDEARQLIPGWSQVNDATFRP
jgi:hypothetical protein